MKASKSVWLIGGVVVLGVVVLLAGPVVSLGGGSDSTGSLFVQPPDQEELARLGSFASDGDADGAAGSAAGAAVADGSGVGAADPASADGAVLDTTTGIGENVSSFSSGDIFGLVWRLALVAGIVYVSIFVLRKFVARSSRVRSESGALKVLETIGLGSNRLVYLLEAGDRVLVVGSTPNQVSLLAELSDPEVTAALRTNADRESPKIASLGDLMRQYGGSMVQRMAARGGRDEGEARARGGFDTGELTPVLQQLLATQEAIAQEARRVRAQEAAPVVSAIAGDVKVERAGPASGLGAE